MTPAITDVPGIAVGHATDAEHLTGCTVVLCEAGAVGGVAVLGGAPGTRETDLLRPDALVDRVHAVVLAGGSAFGLAAADGVMRVLESRGVGFKTGAGPVPIVPAAVIFDLGIGSADVRPGAAMGEAACRAARDGPVAEGNVGAGTGATVGHLLGARSRMKAGVGTWSVHLAGGIVVGALVVTNAFGDVIDPRTGAIVAGARDPDAGGFLGTAARLRGGAGESRPAVLPPLSPPGGTGGYFEHTTIGVVATSAALSKADATRLAIAAHTGLARTVSPSHTSVDGDAFFVLGAPDTRPMSAADRLSLEAAAAGVVSEAVVRSVRLARSAGGAPGLGG